MRDARARMIGRQRPRLIVAALPGKGETVRLTSAEAAHARARRLARGDRVLLLDGSGRAAAASIARMGRDEVVLDVAEIIERSAAGTRRELLVSGLRLERLSWLVEKATELGASRVCIVATGRTQRFRASASVVARLERIAQESAKQSERMDWPSIDGPIEFARALDSGESGRRLFLDPAGEPFPRELPETDVSMLVGPEGGWTPVELDEASSRGWSIVRLPSGKLRAETAAIAALLLARAATQRD